MKSKLRWLLLLLPLALFVWAYQAASWRPKLIGVQPHVPTNIGGLRQLAFGFGPGTWLLVSPDGKQLISAGRDLGGNYLTLWDLAARRQVWQQKRSYVASSWFAPLAFAPDSRTLAIAEDSPGTGYPNIAISLADTATGARRRLPHSSWQNASQSAAFSSNRALVVSTDQGFWVLDTQTGVTLRQFRFEEPKLSNDYVEQAVRSQVSADGSTVIVMFSGDGTDTTVMVYDAKTGRRRSRWTSQQIWRGPQLSPDGDFWSAYIQGTETVEVHNSRDGSPLWRRIQMDTAVLEWSADGRTILTTRGINQQSLSVIDARTGRDLRTIAGAPAENPLALDPRGNALYTTGNQGEIWRWRLR